jgi:hypothetical protein
VEADRRRLSEDGVAKTQARFEEQLQSERFLPGGVHGRDLYIYRALMSGWYTHLSAANCHDTCKLEKIRADWLTYMELVQTQVAIGLLALKASDQSQRDAYAVEFAQIRLRRLAIEDGFAHAVGPEAIEILGGIREKRGDDFSLDGRLAPDGYSFRH